MMHRLRNVICIEGAEGCIEAIDSGIYIGAAGARQRRIMAHILRLEIPNPNAAICNCCDEPRIDGQMRRDV